MLFPTFSIDISADELPPKNKIKAKLVVWEDNEVIQVNPSFSFALFLTG